MTNDAAQSPRSGRRWLAPVGLAILVAGAFFVRLGQDMPMRHHEALIAGTARNMVLDRPVLRDDGSWPSPWLVPNFDGTDRLRKTPLPYWIVAGLSMAAGGVSEWTARLPSAISAAGTVLVLLLILRRWTDRRTAYVGAAILATSVGFLISAREAQADMLMTFCTTSSLAALWMAVERAGRARFAWLLVTGLAAGLAMLAKSPAPLPVLGLPYVVAAAVMIARLRAAGRTGKDTRAEWRWTLGGAAAAVVLFCLMFLPWLLAVPGAWATVWSETTGHSLGSEDDAGEPSLLAFLVRIPVLLGPWTLFLAVGLVMAVIAIIRDRTERAWLVYVLVWLGGTMAAFTLAMIRRDHYLLPMFPAAAACAALCLRHFMKRADAGAKFPDYGLLLLHGAGSILFGLAGVAAYAVFMADPEFYAKRGLSEAWLVPAIFGPVGLLGVANLIAGVGVCMLAVWRKPAAAVAVLVVAMAVMWVGAWTAVWGPTERAVTMRDFSAYVRATVPADATIYYVGTGNRTIIYYVDRVMPLVSDADVRTRMAEGNPFYLVQNADKDHSVAGVPGIDVVRQVTDPYRPHEGYVLMRFAGK
jgi:4-amino-4-deoxy-L-arabinose transferase-like glycosyltransferase